MLNKLLMSETTFLTLMFIIPVVIGVIALICYFIFQYPKDKAKNEARKQAFYEECEKELEYDFKPARVLSKYKNSYYVGIKLSRMVEEYWINLLIEDGTETSYQVSQEMYERIEEGQEGTLVTVNGNFFDFGDGEDVPPEMEEETLEVEEQ